MDNVFKKFYRGFFLKTGGFIPSKPLNQVVLPGDLIQVHQGQTMVLGNIYRQQVIDPVTYHILPGIGLHGANWRLEEGLSRAYLGTETQEMLPDGRATFQKQVLTFQGIGSFFFHGHAPEAVRIGNWSSIADELIVKLTTTQFSFREVYLVTETATTETWTLAVSGAKFARLEITDSDEENLAPDLFGGLSSRATRMREIAYHHRESSRRPSFFKAKKLVVSQDKVQLFMSQLIAGQQYDNSWTRDFFEYDIFPAGEPYPSPITLPTQNSVLDLLQVNQLNPNTALEYFRWEDANLNDIERLFPGHGS